MPVLELSRSTPFPPVELAEPDGLLAAGGDLSPRRLLEAYRRGIFPWYDSDSPILWWAPDPRFVLFPGRLKVSESLRRVVRSGRFRLTFDADFAAVIDACRSMPRRGQDGTWITPEMLDAYTQLHRAGYAHSVEAWQGDTLAGGLYGVSLGAAFFGESMFARVSDASKVALVGLVQRVRDAGFLFIDCQVHTQHLARMGAVAVPRRSFMRLLGRALAVPSRAGNWGEESAGMGALSGRPVPPRRASQERR